MTDCCDPLAQNIVTNTQCPYIMGVTGNQEYLDDGHPGNCLTRLMLRLCVGIKQFTKRVRILVRVMFLRRRITLVDSFVNSTDSARQDQQSKLFQNLYDSNLGQNAGQAYCNQNDKYDQKYNYFLCLIYVEYLISQFHAKYMIVVNICFKCDPCFSNLVFENAVLSLTISSLYHSLPYRVRLLT